MMVGERGVHRAPPLQCSTQRTTAAAPIWFVAEPRQDQSIRK
jgi:hypothetical protein